MSETTIIESCNNNYKITWSSIIAGILSSIFCYILIANLGIAIGFTMINPNLDINTTMLTNALMFWLLITSLVAVIAGSYVASEYSNSTKNKYRFFNGIITYIAVMIIVSFMAFPFASKQIGEGIAFYKSKKQVEKIFNKSIPLAKTKELPKAKIKEVRKEIQKEINAKFTNLHKLSWWGFIIKFLSLFAALLGSWLGSRKD